MNLIDEIKKLLAGEIEVIEIPFQPVSTIEKLLEDNWFNIGDHNSETNGWDIDWRFNFAINIDEDTVKTIVVSWGVRSDATIKLSLREEDVE